jgi:AcrR family transcriptional regulator
MSPYPAQVDRETIINKARELIEADGLDQLSLSSLAAALGIKAPSLYKHVASKTELLRAVNTVTTQRLVGALRAAATDDDPEKRFLGIARVYRDFAHTYPNTYALAFANTQPEIRPDAQQLEQLALPLQAMMVPISGPGESLAALRGVWALIHGFVMLELSGQFQRGGDLSAAFNQAVQANLRGWQTPNTA